LHAPKTVVARFPIRASVLGSDLNRAGGNSRENPLLICLQREAKSASPGGRVQLVEMVRQDADGVRFERQARLERTINLPQAFDMFDKKLAGPVSKHHREKRIARLRFLGADIATSPDCG
jgi:hypothetical protein